MARSSFYLFLILVLGSCVSTTLPIQEYSLAKTAFDAAVSSESAKYAPQLFYRAEKAYKRGEALYKERDFNEARKQFLMCQKLSERAENTSRLKQFNSAEEGDYE
jgi:Domain of unknown function (DUF4398)